jgi:hypothetical protein
MVCYSWPGQGPVLRRQARPEAAEAHASNRTGQTEATLIYNGRRDHYLIESN